MEVQGITLHLSSPDTTGPNWIGQGEILKQLLACWMVVGEKDMPLTPRLIGTPGIGKTALAMAGAAEQGATNSTNGMMGGMGPGGADIPLRGIGPGDGKAQPGHGLAEQAPAAADIQQRKPLEGPQRTGIAPEMGSGFGPDESQPDGVEFVQGRKLACRVPPFRRNGGEFGHFSGVYGGGICHIVSRVEPGCNPVYVGRHQSRGKSGKWRRSR